jgi:hypothetical protein
MKYERGRFVYNIIKELLTKFPELRSDDKRLAWRVWEKEGYVYLDSMSYGGYLSTNRTKEGAIRKNRERVQVENADLRASPEAQALRDKRKKHKTAHHEFVQYRYEGNVAIPVEKDNH